jgi:hypothetical protein
MYACLLVGREADLRPGLGLAALEHRVKLGQRCRSRQPHNGVVGREPLISLVDVKYMALRGEAYSFPANAGVSCLRHADQDSGVRPHSPATKESGAIGGFRPPGEPGPRRGEIRRMGLGDGAVLHAVAW